MPSLRMRIPTRPLLRHASAPVVSRVNPGNACGSGGACPGGAYLSIVGLGFSSWDSSPSGAVAATQCATTSWTSATAALCRTPPGESTARRVTLTAGAQVGTRSSAFTFDGETGRPGARLAWTPAACVPAASTELTSIGKFPLKVTAT